jgi:hypothetical protein
VVEATALYLMKVPLDLVDRSLEIFCAKVDDPVTLTGKYGEVSVVEVNNFASLGENR